MKLQSKQKELIKLEYRCYLKNNNEKTFFKNIQKALIILTPQEIKKLIPITLFNNNKILKKNIKGIFKEYVRIFQ